MSPELSRSPGVSLHSRRMTGYIPLEPAAPLQPNMTAACNDSTENPQTDRELLAPLSEQTGALIPTPRQIPPAISKRRMAGYVSLNAALTLAVKTTDVSSATSVVQPLDVQKHSSDIISVHKDKGNLTANTGRSAVPLSDGKRRLAGQRPLEVSNSVPAPPRMPTSSLGEINQQSVLQQPTSTSFSHKSAMPPPSPTVTIWKSRVLRVLVFLAITTVLVLISRWLRTLEPVQTFIQSYNGHASQKATSPMGIPAWLAWQHFLNFFFMVLVVRTGILIRTEKKPPAYWTPRSNSFFSPPGNEPKKISLSQWLHQGLDVLWMVNGIVFVVLLIVTGQWMRITPTSMDIFPNMLSAGLQYLSLDWPAENGWIHYNALQVVAYFITVFIAAPLAVVSGVRFSTWWPEHAKKLSRAYPIEWARAIHFPVMLYFVGFTAVHVFLVFFTGALENLNHMFTSRHASDAWGLVMFLGSLAVVAMSWILIKPLFTVPVASRMGKISK